MLRENTIDDSHSLPGGDGGGMSKPKATTRKPKIRKSRPATTVPKRSTRSRSIHPVGTIVRKRFEYSEYREGEVTGYDYASKLYRIQYLDGTEDNYDEIEMKKSYKILQKYSHEPYKACREMPTLDETGTWSLLQAQTASPEPVARKQPIPNMTGVDAAAAAASDPVCTDGQVPTTPVTTGHRRKVTPIEVAAVETKIAAEAEAADVGAVVSATESDTVAEATVDLDVSEARKAAAAAAELDKVELDLAVVDSATESDIPAEAAADLGAPEEARATADVVAGLDQVELDLEVTDSATEADIPADSAVYLGTSEVDKLGAEPDKSGSEVVVSSEIAADLGAVDSSTEVASTTNDRIESVKRNQNDMNKDGIITVGRLVEVASRTWPGINKPGGVARVVEVHFLSKGDDDNNGNVIEQELHSITKNPTHVNVRYVVGSSREKQVPVEYVKLAPQYEAHRPTTNDASGNACLRDIAAAVDLGATEDDKAAANVVSELDQVAIDLVVTDLVEADQATVSMAAEAKPAPSEVDQATADVATEENLATGTSAAEITTTRVPVGTNSFSNRNQPTETTTYTTTITNPDESSWYWLLDADDSPSIARKVPPSTPIATTTAASAVATSFLTTGEEEEIPTIVTSDAGIKNARSSIESGAQTGSRSRTNLGTDFDVKSRPRTTKNQTTSSMKVTVSTSNISERVKRRSMVISTSSAESSSSTKSTRSSTRSSSTTDTNQSIDDNPAAARIDSNTNGSMKSKHKAKETAKKRRRKPAPPPRAQRRGTRSSMAHDIGTIVRKRFTEKDEDIHKEGEVVGYAGSNKLYEIKYLDGTFDQYDQDEMKRYYKILQKYSHENYNALRSVPNSKSRNISSSITSTESGIRSRPVDEEGSPVKGRWSWLLESDPRQVTTNKSSKSAVAADETKKPLSDEQSTTVTTSSEGETPIKSQNIEPKADSPETAAAVQQSRRQLPLNQESINSNPDNNRDTLQSSTRSSRASDPHVLPERSENASIPGVGTKVARRKRKREIEILMESPGRLEQNHHEILMRTTKRRDINNSNRYPARSTSARAGTKWVGSRDITQSSATIASKKENHRVASGRPTRTSRTATRPEQNTAAEQSSTAAVSTKENRRDELGRSSRSSRAATRSEKNKAVAQRSDTTVATEDERDASLVLSTRSSRAAARSGKNRATEVSSAKSDRKKNNYRSTRASSSIEKGPLSKAHSSAKAHKIKTKNRKAKLNDTVDNEGETSRRSTLRKKIRAKNIVHDLFLSNWSPSRRSGSNPKSERKRDQEQEQAQETMSSDASTGSSQSSVSLWSTQIALGSGSRKVTRTVSSDGSLTTIDTTTVTVETRTLETRTLERRTPPPGNCQQESSSKLVDEDPGASDTTVVVNETLAKAVNTKTKGRRKEEEQEIEEEKPIDFVFLDVLMKPTSPSQDDVYAMCRNNAWHSMLGCIQSYPEISTMILMHRGGLAFSTTTILHQAIISKSDINIRDPIIRKILFVAPHAAAIKDSSGSLPLHRICQRNLTMSDSVKEMLIWILIDSYPDALTHEAGKTMCTPLHLACKDNTSPELLQMIVLHGAQACFMFDKDGFLPVHIACRHAKSSQNFSPEKLEILLAANPGSIFAPTSDGRTLWDLAKGTGIVPKSNYELLSFIENKMRASGVAPLALQTIASEVGNSVTGNCTEDMTKGSNGEKPEPEKDDAANLLLHFAGRFQNDDPRRLVW